MKKLVFILLGLLVFSCEDIENCNADDNLEVMIVRFFDLENESAKKVGFSIGSGSTVFSGIFSEDSTSIVLPLDPAASTTSFFFVSDTSNHELVMQHEAQFSIFDDKCDPSITFFNLDTVRQTFDSTVVVGTVTNRQLSTNVEIYF